MQSSSSHLDEAKANIKIIDEEVKTLGELVAALALPSNEPETHGPAALRDKFFQLICSLKSDLDSARSRRESESGRENGDGGPALAQSILECCDAMCAVVQTRWLEMLSERRQIAESSAAGAKINLSRISSAARQLETILEHGDDCPPLPSSHHHHRGSLPSSGTNSHIPIVISDGPMPSQSLSRSSSQVMPRSPSAAGSLARSSSLARHIPILISAEQGQRRSPLDRERERDSPLPFGDDPGPDLPSEAELAGKEPNGGRRQSLGVPAAPAKFQVEGDGEILNLLKQRRPSVGDDGDGPRRNSLHPADSRHRLEVPALGADAIQEAALLKQRRSSIGEDGDVRNTSGSPTLGSYSDARGRRRSSADGTLSPPNETMAAPPSPNSSAKARKLHAALASAKHFDSSDNEFVDLDAGEAGAASDILGQAVSRPGSRNRRRSSSAKDQVPIGNGVETIHNRPSTPGYSGLDRRNRELESRDQPHEASPSRLLGLSPSASHLLRRLERNDSLSPPVLELNEPTRYLQQQHLDELSLEGSPVPSGSLAAVLSTRNRTPSLPFTSSTTGDVRAMSPVKAPQCTSPPASSPHLTKTSKPRRNTLDLVQQDFPEGW